MKRSVSFTASCAFVLIGLVFSCQSGTGNDEPVDETQSNRTSDYTELTVTDTTSATTDDGLLYSTANEFVKKMGIGINLGNTFESCGSWINKSSVTNYETAWGSPKITKDMIKGYAAVGIKTVRVPVAWSNMMSTDGNYTINTNYIKRVQEVVTWIINYNMYAIVNIHYDGGWWTGFTTDTDGCMKRYKAMWTQLADAFKGYNKYLVLESLNEEGGWNADCSTGWTVDKSYTTLNQINQAFVDIVRGSSGYNPTRLLLIAGYNTDIDKTCDSRFKMPTDSASMCAVSVHYYTPPTFCILEEDASWGTCAKTWGTSAEKATLKSNMTKMKTAFVDKGIPVIVGEYGCPIKNKEESSVEAFITTACETMFDMGMCPLLWDTTGLHYNRTTDKIIDAVVANKFLELHASL